MNLLAALVPLGLAMMTGGGTQKTSGKGGMGLAESFLVASGAIEGGKGMEGVQPFSTPEMARPRTVAELTRGKPTTTPKMDPIQRIVQSDARVASAVSRMLTESSNQQMRDFSAKYATSATTPQGRKTLITKQPGDIKVV
mgnify:CR=1 FL=1